MESVRALIGQIRKGEILLPEFQRGYVWTSDQVRELVRSMYRKHPTGHLLVWKTYRPGATRNRAEGEGFSLLLLDGQQRLTSLYTLLEGEPPPFYEGEKLYFNLHFNVRTEDFRFWQKTLMQGDASWVSVSEILRGGLGPIFERMASMSDEDRVLFQNPKTLERLNRLSELENYLYTVDRLEGEDLTVEEVVQVFNRVNSAGTPLKKHDLALAHVCSIWPEARQEMRLFAGQVEKRGFGVDLSFLIRCVAGVASDSVLLEGSFYRVSAEDLKHAWAKVARSFEYLADVLEREAYLETIDDLPSPNVLMPITVFLARGDSRFTDENEKVGFLKWMYIAAVWNRYSGSTDTKLQKDVSLLQRPEPVQELIEAIKQDRGRVYLSPKDVEGKAAGSPVYKLSRIAARADGGVDWFSGEPVCPTNEQSHYIFPKKALYRHLRERGYGELEQRRAVNEVANRVFLAAKVPSRLASALPDEYLAEVKPELLQAHAVPMDRELWRLENVERFLGRRRQLLAEAINRLIDGFEVPQTTTEDEADSASLLRQDEHAALEFKSTLRWDVKKGRVNKELERVISKSVAGFLNSRAGGTLLIGVADDRSVYGLQQDYSTLKRSDRDGFENHLIQVLTKDLGVSALSFVQVTFHELEGKDICQVHADPADHPVYVFEGQNSTFYLRIGNSTRLLPPHELAKYVSSRWGAV